ncbi:S-methyl-5'-thioadenosine phosphorylase [Methanothermobacter tenebrarum]|uniref:Probable S-methyl-5'-thioinosine phosphorylase n=1 Tax=Methanothermobacter tenebrarum TaxID=680118 RepID=A0A328PER0_9EURY|nr:S-methyl-5'-thioadenosine phosphorylase [Methanothermobacter tenebrarum]MBC7101084.1 S-methyl-5'-thioadenosine phosphorylase [Methanobacteriales archaeon]MBC7117692.1 S-methyl-5'-thioadenosine phosphorylase [Methanobacteriaceae archaeon]NPV64140.1 S-methyl-5'-thioadenosine phosphorylase [Methanobacteriaceae archaeon]RAO79761.1 S-methyl-5'-thioadenosine phosphorylase [Methanothermobacter tenebrarum]
MIGIIGGTGIYKTPQDVKVEKKIIKTPYGDSPPISIFKIHDKKVAFIPRHAEGHDYPPHKINYRANIWALKHLGVNKIIATNTAGSLHKFIKPGTIVTPDDFLDFTKTRIGTFYDKNTVHVDVTKPYCPKLRNILLSSGEVEDGGVYVCTEGPRFETAAEIRMFKILGGTIVGMTGLPEAVLARELEMCYASLCLVSNYAASISEDKLTIKEVFNVLEEKRPIIVDIINRSVEMIDESPCECHEALKGASVDEILKGEMPK